MIDHYQVFVSSVSVGVGGIQLESTAKSRRDEAKVVELGRTIVEILKLSPGGVLVFFPSYSAMSHYVNMWKVGIRLFWLVMVIFIVRSLANLNRNVEQVVSTLAS